MSMSKVFRVVFLGSLLAACGGGDDTTDAGGNEGGTDAGVDQTSDVTVKPDVAPEAAPDTGNDVTVEADASDAEADVVTDAGTDALPPEGTPCTPPNSIQDEPCGLCGTHYRACLASGDGGFVWGGWGFCQNEVVNGCDPNATYQDLSCGNCGTQKQVCLSNCTFDLTQACTEPVDACKPGSTEFKAGLSCDGGGRLRTCDNQCSWGNWGQCTSGFTPHPDRGLALGYYHTCGINGSGTLKCWGRNTQGQLGNGTNTSSSSPVSVSNIGSSPLSIGAGYEHTCAVASDGTTYCWGYNTYGQVGDGTTTNKNVPTQVSGLATASRVESGYYHSCAILADSTMSCWGYNSYGQLGDNTTTNSSTPVAVNNVGTAIDLDMGIYHHSCNLLTSGEMQCWGYNIYGALGDGTTTSKHVPTTVSLSLSAISISAGGYHSCAVLSDNSVYCWGDNLYGQLGNGNTTDQHSPVSANLGNVTMIASGYRHNCALTTAGEVKCIGYNTYGQLGNGTTTNSGSWVTAISSGAVAVACGEYHSCALMQNGDLECWGYNSDGQIGDGTTTNRSSPTVITGF